MNRGIDEEDGLAVLWRNFYGDSNTNEQELVEEFERNSKKLRQRANGNVLYHEIMSFSRGYKLKDDELFRAVADIGEEYLSQRAPNQLAYGVIHRDTDHIHLHMMISSNPAGKSERVRLSKQEFSDIQKRIEELALNKYPELAQTKVYTKPRSKEKLKTQAHEQAMRSRTKEPSRKETLKAKVHQLFEQAVDFVDLGRLLEGQGARIYQRGKSVGLIVEEPDGTERRHRLSSLGLEEHFLLTNSRLLALPEQRGSRAAPMAEGATVKEPPLEEAPSRTKERFRQPGTAEKVAEEPQVKRTAQGLKPEDEQRQERKEREQKKGPSELERFEAAYAKGVGGIEGIAVKLDEINKRDEEERRQEKLRAQERYEADRDRGEDR